MDIAGILERVAPVFEIMRAAAKTKPDIAELFNKLLEERLQNLAKVVQRLSARSTLRAGLDDEQAAEIVWTITSPEVFCLLTVDRGWPRERYCALARRYPGAAVTTLEMLGTSLSRLNDESLARALQFRTNVIDGLHEPTVDDKRLYLELLQFNVEVTDGK